MCVIDVPDLASTGIPLGWYKNYNLLLTLTIDNISAICGPDVTVHVIKMCLKISFHPGNKCILDLDICPTKAS